MITYDVKGLQDILHLTDLQAAALMRTDGFPSNRIGRTYVVTEDALQDWLKSTKDVKLDYTSL